MLDGDTTPSATAFYLMRHAPTEWNRAGRIQGQADSPLTPVGRQWAARWGVRLAHFQIERLLTSDIGRAITTVREMNTTLKRPVIVDARLREQDWGRWTGCVHRLLRTEDAATYARQQALGWHFRPPGGESHLEVLERAMVALRNASTAYPGEHILVVAHEGVLKCLIYHLAIRDGCGHQPPAMAPYHLHHILGFMHQLVLKRMNALDLNPGSGEPNRVGGTL
jgi:probable phosphoglycerate mutase